MATTNPDTIIVSVWLTDLQKVLIKRAVVRHFVPPGWRPAEYVMTKVTAMEGFIDLTANGKTSLFKMQCLIGEVARLAAANKHPADLVECFTELMAVIRSHPEADRYTKFADAADVARAKSTTLRSRAEELIREAEEQDRLAARLPQLAQREVSVE